MENNDPTLILIKEVGMLTGVISEQSKTLREIKGDMKEKIGRDTCETIVNAAIDNHRSTDHKQKASRPPAAPVTLWESIPMKAKVSMVIMLFTVASALITYFTTN